MALAWKVEEREGRGFCLFANKSLLPGLAMTISPSYNDEDAKNAMMMMMELVPYLTLMILTTFRRVGFVRETSVHNSS